MLNQYEDESTMGRSQKKTGKCGNFGKTGGGGLPESHFHFLLFLTWETPPKMQNKP